MFLSDKTFPLESSGNDANKCPQSIQLKTCEAVEITACHRSFDPTMATPGGRAKYFSVAVPAVRSDDWHRENFHCPGISWRHFEQRRSG
jgi:hypothetical protein